MHITSPIRTKDTVDTLARLWEASVRRSHHFLTEADIRRLTPFVKSGLGHIERLFVTYVQNVPAGFIGLEKTRSKCFSSHRTSGAWASGKNWY